MIYLLSNFVIKFEFLAFFKKSSLKSLHDQIQNIVFLEIFWKIEKISISENNEGWDKSISILYCNCLFCNKSFIFKSLSIVEFFLTPQLFVWFFVYITAEPAARDLGWTSGVSRSKLPHSSFLFSLLSSSLVISAALFVN